MQRTLVEDHRISPPERGGVTGIVEILGSDCFFAAGAQAYVDMNLSHYVKLESVAFVKKCFE